MLKALLKTSFPMLGAVGLLASGCGDNDTCAEGETQSNGQCVIGGGCGDGTVLDPETKQCVPDGSMVCTQGTVFDAETSTCIVDPSACDDGTVLVEGICVPDDETLEGMADVVEADEPNDDGIAGSFEAPAEGESVTFFGCIEPTGDVSGNNNAEQDVDVWVIDAPGPMLLDIKADGIRGLSAAFILQNGDIANSPELDNFVRFGINLTGDTSQRQVYLPIGGIYALFMDDSRSLFLDTAGTDDACYFTTVTGAALPAATPLAGPLQRFEHSGDVVTFSYTAENEADILVTEVLADGAPINPAYIATRDSNFVISASGVGSAAAVGALETAGDDVTLIFDPVFNYAQQPQPIAFEVFEMPATELSIDGTATTVTKRNGVDVRRAFTAPEYLYFDIAAGGAVVHFDMTSDVPVNWQIVSPNVLGPTLASISGFLGTTDTFSGEHVRFLEAGRYYLTSSDPVGVVDETYTITATLTEIIPSAIAYGTLADDQELPATGEGFHTINLGNRNWSQFNLLDAPNIEGPGILAYDVNGEGWLRADLGPITSALVANDGTNPLGLITRNLAFNVLVHVFPTGAVTDPATYDVLVGDRDFVDLGALTSNTPVNADDVATVAGVPTRFFMTGVTADRATAVLSSLDAAADGTLTRLNRGEGPLASVNANGAGLDETLTDTTVLFAPETFLAFTVTTDVDDTINFDVSSTSPSGYNAAAGNLAFADVCGDPNAEVLLENADDDVSDLRPVGFALDFFGVAVTDYAVNSNGLVSFDGQAFGAFSPAPIPTQAGPNNIVAPFWADLNRASVCVLEEAAKLTIQWEGGLFANNLEVALFQAIIHDTGRIEFVFADEHTVRGGESTDGFFGATPVNASIGIENRDGLFGTQIGFAEGIISGGDSFVLTPQ